MKHWRTGPSVAVVFIFVLLMSGVSYGAGFGGSCHGKTCEVLGLGDGTQQVPPGDPGGGKGGGPAEPPPRFLEILTRTDEDLGGCETRAGVVRCGPQRNTCESNGAQVQVDDVDVARQVSIGGSTGGPEGGVNFEVDELDTRTGDRAFSGYTCGIPGVPGGAEGQVPVVVTVSVSDFAELPVVPMQANAGPEIGWIPVNMEVVLYVNGEDQVLETTILNSPVSVRAVPIEYEWDMGDGNTITTSKPGAPYPSMEVAGVYRYEGWYDVTLTTTFAGQFSVDGGEWQDIDGTITIESEPVEIFSKSLESRLVNSDVPVDVDEDPWVPERSPETEGELDPEATHREI